MITKDLLDYFKKELVKYNFNYYDSLRDDKKEKSLIFFSHRKRGGHFHGLLIEVKVLRTLAMPQNCVDEKIQAGRAET